MSSVFPPVVISCYWLFIFSLAFSLPVSPCTPARHLSYILHCWKFSIQDTEWITPVEFQHWIRVQGSTSALQPTISVSSASSPLTLTMFNVLEPVNDLLYLQGFSACNVDSMWICQICAIFLILIFASLYLSFLKACSFIFISPEYSVEFGT